MRGHSQAQPYADLWLQTRCSVSPKITCLTSTNGSYVSATVSPLQRVCCCFLRIIKTACGAAGRFYGHFTECCIFFAPCSILIPKDWAMHRNMLLYSNKQMNWNDTLCLEHLCRSECEAGWWIHTSKDRYTASPETHAHSVTNAYLDVTQYAHLEVIKCFIIVLATDQTTSILNLIFLLPFPLLNSGKVI